MYTCCTAGRLGPGGKDFTDGVELGTGSIRVAAEATYLSVPDALGVGGLPLALLALVAAAAHGVRWWLWQPWRTRRVPLVWVLHLAYAWVPAHLLLRAAARQLDHLRIEFHPERPSATLRRVDSPSRPISVPRWSSRWSPRCSGKTTARPPPRPARTDRRLSSSVTSPPWAPPARPPRRPGATP